MSAVFSGVVIVLLLTLVIGLLRIWRGPDEADRMLSAQLLGTAGVAILLVLAEMENRPELRDVALVLAVLAAVASAAFVTRFREGDDERG